jgi:cold shock CspA family protein
VPVKLVVTDDSDVITEVIKATNRQTAVLPEALASLTPFHKELEDFYAAQEAPRPKDNRIFYERRSKQYAYEKIKPSNIVTLTAQTKSFVAMFLNEPHSHPRYYGELLNAYEARLFNNDHRPSAYYASGYALLAVEQLFNSNALDRAKKKWKYHILMLLRMQIGGIEMPRFNSSQMDGYALGIVRELRSEDNRKVHCDKALRYISEELKKFEQVSSEDSSRLRAFTAQLIESFKGPIQLKDPVQLKKQIPKELLLGTVESGTILWYDDWRNFGFIERDSGGDIFVHRSGLEGVPWHKREAGTRVSYTVSQGPSTLKADNVHME